MAKNKTIDVWMLRRVLGEEGEVLPAASKQTVRFGFGRELILGHRAEEYNGQDRRGSNGEFPEGFPGVRPLLGAGITSVDGVPRSMEELVAIKGIGDALAASIIEAVEAGGDDEE